MFRNCGKKYLTELSKTTEKNPEQYILGEMKECNFSAFDHLSSLFHIDTVMFPEHWLQHSLKSLTFNSSTLNWTFSSTYFQLLHFSLAKMVLVIVMKVSNKTKASTDKQERQKKALGVPTFHLNSTNSRKRTFTSILVRDFVVIYLLQ